MTNTTTRRFPLATIVLGSYEGTECPTYRDEVARVATQVSTGAVADARAWAQLLTGQTYRIERW